MINKLIYKYLRFKSSEKETEQLFEWINKSEKNKQTFIKLKQSWALNSSSKYEANELANVKKAIGIETKSKGFYQIIFKYAAIVIVFLTIGGIAIYSGYEPNQPEAVSQITISTENGQNIVVPEEAIHKFLTLNNSQQLTIDNKKLQYSNHIKETNPEMHTIHVPYGKTFEIVLEDGTRVHLNSGSTLSYPSYFRNDQNRIVILSGEAYFEVKQDFGRPFSVKTSSLEVLVTGTRFNLSAYDNDKTTEASLFEGSIKIIKEVNQQIDTLSLSPGFGHIWDKHMHSSTILEIYPEDYISWIEGELVFKDTSFKNLIAKLERSYNVSIYSNYLFLETQKFTGKFKTNELSISDILKIISIDTPFSFEIINNKIIINSPSL